MLTIISFILTLLGSINWLMIGLLQYDFVAGIFGYQASVFSRLIYIIIGASAGIIIFKLIKGRGTLAVLSRRNKKDVAEKINKMQHKDEEKTYSNAYNVEASQDFIDDDFNADNEYKKEGEISRGLFDEHFDKREK